MSTEKTEKIESLHEVVYTPEPALRQPVDLTKGMISDLILSRGLAWRLFVRNISARYRQSLLGYAWALVPPLATTLVWVFLNSNKIIDVGNTDIPYPAFVLIGTMLWQSFVEAIQSPLNSVSASSAMLSKIDFPKEALIITGIGEVLFNLLIRLVLLVGVFLWFGLTIPATIVLAPFGILAIIILGIAIGLILTPFGMLFTDIRSGLGMIVRFWFFLTPIVYPPPTTWPLSLIATANPVSPLIVTTRDFLTTGQSLMVTEALLVTGFAIILLIGGSIFYRISMPHIIERMSA